MGIITALFNQKGGVGKTTTCANLSAAIALKNKRVLAVDFDPQSNLTSGFGINRKTLKHTVYHVLVNDAEARNAVISTEIEGLDLLPANIDLAGAEIEMSNLFQRETVLSRALSDIKDDYDCIFIDCPPSLGLLPINALAAADNVLIPIQCEYYALEGVSQLINTVNLVKRSLNTKLEVLGVIMTMYDSRTNLSQQVYEEVNNYFSTRVFRTIVPRNVRLAEAPSHGLTIMQYDVRSKGAEAYDKLADEIISRLKI